MRLGLLATGCFNAAWGSAGCPFIEARGGINYCLQSPLCVTKSAVISSCSVMSPGLLICFLPVGCSCVCSERVLSAWCYRRLLSCYYRGFSATWNFRLPNLQGSQSRVYGLLITRVSLKINGGMWLIVYDQQSKYSGLICFFQIYSPVN